MNMRTQDALEAFGLAAASLSAGEKQQLDEQGYLPLPGVLSPDECAALRLRYQQLARAEGEAAGSEFHQEAGALRLSNLVDKDPLFDICYSHPRVLSAISHVLAGDFKLSSLNGRAALPGEGLQRFHADWGSAVEPPNFQVCNSIWLLVDFTAENGATRVVPGSHRSGQLPQDALANPEAPHPEEVLLTARAGAVVVFNSHIWHGGTTNRTDAPRYALHAYFTRRRHPQQVNQKQSLSEATVARLSPAARFILDA